MSPCMSHGVTFGCAGVAALIRLVCALYWCYLSAKVTEAEKWQPMPSNHFGLVFFWGRGGIGILFFPLPGFSFLFSLNSVFPFSSLICFLCVFHTFFSLSLLISTLFLPISFFSHNVICFSPKQRMLWLEILRYIYLRFVHVLMDTARLSKHSSINFVFHQVTFAVGLE